MSFVIGPLSLVLVAVDVPESSMTVCFVESPVALVAGTVLPDLSATTMSILALPLSDILRTIFENKLRPVLNIVRIVRLIRLQL